MRLGMFRERSSPGRAGPREPPAAWRGPGSILGQVKRGQAVLGWSPCSGGLRGWWQEQGRVASSIPLFLPFPSLGKGSGVSGSAVLIQVMPLLKPQLRP